MRPGVERAEPVLLRARGGTRSARSRAASSSGRCTAWGGRAAGDPLGPARSVNAGVDRVADVRVGGAAAIRQLPFTRVNWGCRKTELFGSFQASHRLTLGRIRPLAVSRNVPL